MMNERGNGSNGSGTRRNLRVTLDSAQYYEDKKRGRKNVYESFNVVVRRSGKENNFHAVLETMRDLMRGEFKKNKRTKRNVIDDDIYSFDERMSDIQEDNFITRLPNNVNTPTTRTILTN